MPRDGKSLVTGDWRESTIDFWDVATGQFQRRLVGHKGGIMVLLFSPDGKTLASSGGWHADASIRLWDTATGRELRRLPGHPNQTSSLAFAPDGRTLASVGEDNRGDVSPVRLWDVASGEERSRLGSEKNTGLEQTPAPGRSVAWSPDGRLLAAADRQGHVRFWNVARGEECGRIGPHQGKVAPVKFAPDGKLLFTPGYDTTILVWDVAALARP